MNFKPSIRPIVDFQAYILVSMTGEYPSSQVKQLLHQPLVKGVALSRDNVRSSKQFFKLIQSLRSMTSQCLIMVDVNDLINVAIWMQTNDAMITSEKYQTQAHVNGIFERQIGVYATVDTMVKLYKTYQIIPKFTPVFAESGLFDEHRKTVLKINKMFYNTMIEMGAFIHCQKQAKDQLVPSKHHYSIDFEQKEMEEVSLKLKATSAEINDAAFLDLLPNLKKSPLRLVHLTINDTETNWDVSRYATQIAAMSNYVDLIDVPLFDEARWLRVIDYLMFNPRIEVDLKFRYLSPSTSETIVKNHSTLCCGFF